MFKDIEENMFRQYFLGEVKKPPPKKRIVEPLVNAGLIPEHPFIKLWNKQLKD